MISLRLEKFQPFTHDVIFVDGLWGSGKSLIGPIVSGMHRVEIQKLDERFEYVCILRALNKLEPDAAIALLKTWADLGQYHNHLGREVNLRWTDDSGFANNPGATRYLRRLFSREGDHVVAAINRENRALQIMSHMILAAGSTLEEAFGERLRVVEVVRHPLYLVGKWQSYLASFERPREFTVSFSIGGQKVPWFAADWHEEYLSTAGMDRTIACLTHLNKRLFDAIDGARARGTQLLVLSFEQVALDSQRCLDQVREFLGRDHHPSLARILRRQRLPRRVISEGRGTRFMTSRADAEATEKKQYERLLREVEDAASARYRESFLKLALEYNNRWPSVLSRFP